ncbi:acetoacetate decarboxylase family protein [Williamsia deligens]|uniref:Acetoacetate decarboxylase family protein n=1 Tax=Williamsia deligens TaxID=321325 RepID=A0ABW3GA29_9NOCA|nr:acetoacetate decarboxylase family protein [Williamsia deligens]MCP2196042.1 Acetoacetate decarboxylase (ADC) [Williamsia deligens]
MTARAETYTVLGREVASPVEIRHATAFTAMVSVSAEAVATLLEPTGLSAMTWRPGRALCAIVFVDYVDGDLGPYNEFGVCFLVHHHRPGAGASGMRALLRGEVCAYIHRLPVDGDFTLAAGREIWGFPKTLADFDCRHRSVRPHGSVRADGREIVDLRLGRGLSVPDSSSSTTLTAYSHLDSTLRATPWTMRAASVRTRPGGARISLGDHPIADELRGLDIGTTLMSSSIGHLSMTFGDAEVVHPDAR